VRLERAQRERLQKSASGWRQEWVKSESESVRCEMRWGCDAPDEAVQSVLVRTLNATRLRRNTVIVIVIGDRIRKRLESDTTRLYWCESHESGGGEKHAQNCVCMSSTALFLLAAPLAWRSSTQHCIGQETCRPASTAAQSAPNQGPFHSNQTRCRLESTCETRQPCN
jgi:hypothetical protein